jgi:serpin B
VLPSFIDTTEADFGASVEPLDFSNIPATLAAINGWASAATDGKIPQVVTALDSTADMMFLLNAIYFKGNWRSQFDASQTIAATFAPAMGPAEPVRLMQRTDGMSYVETPTYQAVDLPYGDSTFAMTVILPKANTSVESVAAGMNGAAWQSLVSGLRTDSVALSLPRITIAYERFMTADLAEMGMPEPVNCIGAADFSRMIAPPAGNNLLCIHYVKQNSFVDINEAGTEAAAVTTVSVGIFVSERLGPIVMRVDHPYIVVIRERLTGTILFMGKIAHIPS